MRLSKLALPMVLVAVSSTAMALGYVIGSTNFDILGYPSFTSKHRKPYKPYSKDEFARNNYKYEVEKYIRDAKKYLEAANNDIERIEEEKSESIKAVNEVVEDYNNYVRYGD